MVDLGRVRLFGKAMRCIKVATLRLEDAAMPMQRAFHGRLTSQSAAVLPVPQFLSASFTRQSSSVLTTYELRQMLTRTKSVTKVLLDCPTAFRSDSTSEIYAA